MCGRFAFYSAHEAIVRLFQVPDSPEVEPHYNIAPTQYVATVRAHSNGDRKLSMLYWGLVPWWSKEKEGAARLINARAESVRDKPAFREAYRQRRCLVLANGYYEWLRTAAIRQPYFIRLASGDPFGMAGLWESWRDPADGQRLESCTIVTTNPASSIAHIHDRMPVILPLAAHAEWLDPANDDPDRLDRLLVPYAPELLASHRVSTRVNSARNDSPDLPQQSDEPLRNESLDLFADSSD